MVNGQIGGRSKACFSTSSTATSFLPNPLDLLTSDIDTNAIKINKRKLEAGAETAWRSL